MRKNIHQLFEEFLFEAEYVKKIKPKTVQCYKKTFSLLVKIVPAVSLDTITPYTMASFFKTLQERKRITGKGIIKTGIKKSTVASYWSKLNAFFLWLQANEYIAANPFTTLTRPSPSYEDKKFLKKEEIEKILTAIHSHHDNNLLILKRNLVLFYILLYCGLRREELLQLQVRDIDFEKRILTVRGETSKSGRSRQLPVHSSLLMYLKDYLAARRHYTTASLIVSSKRDEQLTIAGLIHLFTRLQKYAGVSFHPHQLRHTFAVNFLHCSKDISKLKQLLGHRSLSMTLVYLRCLPIDEMRTDIEMMNIDTLI